MMKAKVINHSKTEKNTSHPKGELDRLCRKVRALVAEEEYGQCIQLICEAMVHSPHAPHPHNLMGIVLERQGDHAMAMRHFRAARALDPAYAPALHNLDAYGTFFSHGKCAFDEKDVAPSQQSNIEIYYDERGVGHVVGRSRVEYDEKRIGHVVRR